MGEGDHSLNANSFLTNNPLSFNSAAGVKNFLHSRKRNSSHLQESNAVQYSEDDDDEMQMLTNGQKRKLFSELLMQEPNIKMNDSDYDTDHGLLRFPNQEMVQDLSMSKTKYSRKDSKAGDGEAGKIHLTNCDDDRLSENDDLVDQTEEEEDDDEDEEAFHSKQNGRNNIVSSGEEKTIPSAGDKPLEKINGFADSSEPISAVNRQQSIDYSLPDNSGGHKHEPSGDDDKTDESDSDSKMDS